MTLLMAQGPIPKFFSARAGGTVLLVLAWLTLAVGLFMALAISSDGFTDGGGGGLSESQARTLAGIAVLFQAAVVWGVLLAFRGMLDLLMALYQEARRGGVRTLEPTAVDLEPLTAEMAAVKRHTAAMADAITELIEEIRLADRAVRPVQNRGSRSATLRPADQHGPADEPPQSPAGSTPRP